MELALLFLPLVSFIISGFFGKYIGDRLSEIITSLFVIASALLSIAIFYNYFHSRSDIIHKQIE